MWRLIPGRTLVIFLLAAAFLAALLGIRACLAEDSPQPHETLTTLLDEPLTSVPGVTAPPDTAPPDTAPPDGALLSAPAIEVVLLQVIDGDTIRVRMPDGREERVRYIGIDAPEVTSPDSAGEYLGEEASLHNKELLASGPLRLQTDVEERDGFGRLLAYVWVGMVFINERMVADGYACARNYPPNLSRQDVLWAAHDAARKAGIGIWDQTGR